MKTLVVTGKLELVFKEVEKPKISKGKVLIKVAYCGVCGSDLPRYFDGAVHSFPQILGHEFSGIVEEIGEDVSKIRIGDRVAIAPLVPCGACFSCHKGFPGMCSDYSFIGSREPGAMAEYVSVPEQNCVKVPENVSLKEAALVEPLTVAIHGIERVSICAGDSVIIYGAGAIGLLTLLSLRARGVGEIIVVDINNRKLKIAKELGADLIVNPMEDPLGVFFENHGLPKIVIETAGSPITQIAAINFVEKRGKVVYVGTCTRDIQFPPEIFEKIVRNELIVTGSWMSYSAPFPGYEWDAALRYMGSKEIDVASLITGVFKLENGTLPFNDMVKKDSEQIKLLYKIAEDD